MLRNFDFKNLLKSPRKRIEEHNSSLMLCFTCQLPSASPIYTCSGNGHLTCGICYEKLLKKDPNNVNCVKCQTELVINSFSEQLSHRLKVMGICPYKDSGCKAKIQAVHLMEHIESCEYREMYCHYKDSETGERKQQCEHLLGMKCFAVHWTKIHGEQLLNGSKECSIYYPVQILSKKDGNSALFWEEQPQPKPLLIVHDGKLFQLHSKIHKHTFHWWIVILGAEKDAENYVYLTKLVDPCKKKAFHDKKETDYKMPVLAYHKHQVFDQYNAHYATATAAKMSALAFSYGEEVRVRISMKIKRVSHPFLV